MTLNVISSRWAPFVETVALQKPMPTICRPSRRALRALLILVTFVQLGCGRAGFVEPVTSFQEASSVVIASTRVYLTELNKVEREHYLNEQASKKLQIKLTELEAVQVFTREGLKARLDALDQLARYGGLL